MADKFVTYDAEATYPGKFVTYDAEATYPGKFVTYDAEATYPVKFVRYDEFSTNPGKYFRYDEPPAFETRWDWAGVQWDAPPLSFVARGSRVAQGFSPS